MFNPFIDIPQRPFDFGNTQKARVAGTVFDDLNLDGVIDPGEQPAAGQTVYLDLNRNGINDVGEPSAVTDAAGRYAFELDAGSYLLVVVPNAGWTFTQPDTAMRDVTLAQGQELGGQDFGLRRIAHTVTIFYNNSSFDGNDPNVNAGDDAAQDVTKLPLSFFTGIPGSFLNVTSYAKGLNGIMIDMDLPPSPFGGLPLSAADFIFRVGNDNDPGSWPAAPDPTAVVVREGAGGVGTDRVTIVFADNAVRNTWLQLTILADAHTGFAVPEVFYFGNLVGETGDAGSPLRVGSLDLAGVRRRLNTTALIDNPYDFNRDGRVNSLDLAAVRANLNRTLAPLTAPPALVAGTSRRSLFSDLAVDRSAV